MYDHTTCASINTPAIRTCPGCNSRGFAMSLLGPGRCEFCDGTEGGCGPRDPAGQFEYAEEIAAQAAIPRPRLEASIPTESVHSTGTVLNIKTGRALVRPWTRIGEWKDARTWLMMHEWTNGDQYPPNQGVSDWVRALVRDTHSPMGRVADCWGVVY